MTYVPALLVTPRCLAVQIDHFQLKTVNQSLKMVRAWGMSDLLGPLSYSKDAEQIFLGREIAQHRDYSEATAQKIDDEINRLIIPGMIMKKAMQGELPFFAAAQQVAEELTGMPSFAEPGEPEFLEEEGKLIANMNASIAQADAFIQTLK